MSVAWRTSPPELRYACGHALRRLCIGRACWSDRSKAFTDTIIFHQLCVQLSVCLHSSVVLAVCDSKAAQKIWVSSECLSDFSVAWVEALHVLKSLSSLLENTLIIKAF